ncbi:MAG: glycosyltransferase family 2 protein [Candidatus Sumerlaeota bacterium]|nr:glycosyltransferase family 2 protein [Candidatus Sumerlaeota bacterium]
MEPEISIIVPVKNEEANIRPQVEEIRQTMAALARPFEILYVDDGSTDGSWAALLEMRPRCPELRLLRLDRNHGQSAATDAGIRHARGRILATLDGDMQNVPADIPRLLDALRDADMVCGYRVARRDTAWRRFQSRLANGIRNWLTGDTIIDTGCSLKAFKREAFANVKFFNGMHRFMPTLARMDGFRVAQIPVSHRPRRRGKTKYSMRNRLFKSFHDLLAVRWMQKNRLSYRVAEDIPAAVDDK